MSESDPDVNGFEYVRSEGASGKTSEHEEVASYRAWLESKYVDVASLNEACGGNYSSFDEFSRQSIAKSQEKSNSKETEESSCTNEEPITKVPEPTKENEESVNGDVIEEGAEEKGEEDSDDKVEEDAKGGESEYESVGESAENEPVLACADPTHPTWGISNMLSSFWLGRQSDSDLATPPSITDLPTPPLGDSDPEITGCPNPGSEEKSADDSPTEEKSADDSPADDSPAEDTITEDTITEDTATEDTATEDTATEDTADDFPAGDTADDFPAGDTADQKAGEDDCKEDGCFVVVANDEPVFYMSTHQAARDKMRELADRLRGGYADYHVYIEVQSADEIHVVGNYRYYVISHTRTLDRLRVQEVPKFTNYSFTVDLAKNLLRTVYGVW